MKKIIIAEDLRSIIEQAPGFLDRSDIKVIPVGSNNEALEVHREERADLIITRLDMPRMSCERFCSIVRSNRELCRVSIIVVCPCEPELLEAGKRCKANAVLDSADKDTLLEKARQLLDVKQRMDFRVPISVKVDGMCEEKPFLGYSENISASGMLFETDRKLAPGGLMECRFILPDATRIRARAEVVRSVKPYTSFDPNPIQYGVRFLELSDEDRASIERYVGKCSIEAIDDTAEEGE